MSEYQYYEFLAIDKPLTSKDMSALRALSTRADITPVSFVNEYNWGDFKGNPDNLMQRFFDAHVYVANWGMAIFKLCLPIEVLTKETAKAMAVRYILDFKATKIHWIITWSLEESENYDRFALEDGGGWMARLSPIRDELLRGDIRSLYIGWLAAMSWDIMDDDQMEPLPVEGLGNLTPAQKALADFLEVDTDLLKGAGMGNSARKTGEPSQKEIDGWVEGLSRNEVTLVLKQLLAGKGHQAERLLKNWFAEWRRELLGNRTDEARRTIGELRQNAELAKKKRLEQERNRRKQQEVKRLKEREKTLKALSKDFPKSWKSVLKTIERGSGLAYDEACRNIVDLSESYSLFVNRKLFEKELKKFMANHLQRKALIQRLTKAGIWPEK